MARRDDDLAFKAKALILLFLDAYEDATCPEIANWLAKACPQVERSRSASANWASIIDNLWEAGEIREAGKAPREANGGRPSQIWRITRAGKVEARRYRKQIEALKALG